jgi:hypothetical protein
MASDAFRARLDKGLAFEQWLKAELERSGVPVFANSFSQSAPELPRWIRQSSSPAARFERWRPDGMLKMNQDVVYWDGKASSDVERGPWLSYLHRAREVGDVLLFVSPEFNEHPNARVYCQRVSLIQLEDPSLTVKQYRTSWPLKQFEDGLWICRGGTGNDRWSGTPFRRMLLRSLVFWRTRRQPDLFVPWESGKDFAPEVYEWAFKP